MTPEIAHPQPVRVLMSKLTGSAYAVTRYSKSPDGAIMATSEHDATEDVVRNLMAAAWARGWNECNAAGVGAAAANRYRRVGPDAQPATG